MQTESLNDKQSASEGAIETSDSRSAGDLLLEERQRLGLNEKEVADQLHITMHYVKALESDSYEKLPGAVFAKGYLRSYGLLLGLDVDDLLARYEDLTSQKKAVSEEASRLNKARRNKDRNKPLIAASLVIFVGGFLGLWLVNNYFAEPGAGSAPVTVADRGTGGANQAGQTQLAAQPQLTLESDVAAPATTTSEPVTGQSFISDDEPQVDLAAVDASPGALPEPQQEEDESNPAQVDLASALQALAAQQSAEPSPVATAEPNQSRVISIDAVGSDVLRLTFSGECWVEVNDSASQQIYRDIREAGDVLEITGSAPFNILLGDAPFTRMTLNGAEIDLSSDIRIDNSARLTVGL